MTGPRAVSLRPGSRFVFDGETVEVTGLEGGRLTLRDARDRWQTVGLSVFLARAVAFDITADDLADDADDVDAAAAAGGGGAALVVPVGTSLATLSSAERRRLTARAGHVREVLSGYRSGTASIVGPGEPRSQYDPARPLAERVAAKSVEVGVSERTLRRWLRAYTATGEVGLVDGRGLAGRGSVVDPRWDETCRMVIAERVAASTPTTGALLRAINERLGLLHG